MSKLSSKFKSGHKYRMPDGDEFWFNHVDLMGFAHVKFTRDKDELTIRLDLLEADEGIEDTGVSLLP